VFKDATSASAAIERLTPFEMREEISNAMKADRTAKNESLKAVPSPHYYVRWPRYCDNESEKTEVENAITNAL
jgi:hypothetical protein